MKLQWPLCCVLVKSQHVKLKLYSFIHVQPSVCLLFAVIVAC